MAELTIGTGTVDLVHVTRGRIIAESPTRGFDLFHSIQGFVVGIPSDPIHKTDPLHQTHRDCGATFNRAPGFAAHEGTDRRLAEADPSIGEPMTTGRVHPELLPIPFLNHKQLAVAVLGEGDQQPLLG